MAKGDQVVVQVANGTASHMVNISASKAGRTVAVKYGARWIEVAEMTRPTAAHRRGRPVGNLLKVRTEAVISIMVMAENEEPEAPTTRRKAATPEPLGLE